MKSQLTEWKKIFANHVCCKELISKYIKNSYNSMAKSRPIKWQGFDRCFSEEDIGTANSNDKMPDISYHQGDANQSHNEIPVHIS